MANFEHLAILKQGVETWNRWRKKRLSVTPDLERADLFEAHLHEANLNGANTFKANLARANLSGANLSGADLRSANLSGANLSGADLIGASLIGASLGWANLHGTDLIGADLSKAHLNFAYFSETSLDQVDLSGARLAQTTFADVDLSNVKGLEIVIHAGPSSIGIDTIYKSKGTIPHIFLRGCGVPENFIEYMASLVGTGIEFYSLFISYSTKDQEFADRLYADLQAKGVRCWFAPHDIRAGRKIHEQIDEAIRVYDKLLLILSPASMESEWVKTEISKARKREIKEGKRILFPIRLCSFEALRDWECFDSDAGKDSAREIREYFIPDFSNWKDHDDYRKAFDRLLHDLQGKTNPA